jgi:heptosyltransferase-2
MTTGSACVAVFLPNWVGDVAMATPTLRALKGYVGSAGRLIGILRPHLFAVLAGTAWLDERWGYDPRAAEPELRGRSVARRLRAARVDVAVLLTNTIDSAWLSLLGRVPERIGYVRNRRGALLTRKLRPPSAGGRRIPISTVDYYLELVRLLPRRAALPHADPVPDARLELATTPADERAADEAWQALGLGGGRRTIACNSSGAFGAAKLWPDESFAALAHRLARRFDDDLLFLCGPAERERAARIVASAAHPRVKSLATLEPSIGLSKACVRRSRLLVTTDSGPRHFAAAFGVPSVTLFGPTDPAWSDNHSAGDRALRLDLDCSPCQRRVCPLGHHRCMRELSVDVVESAVARMLDGCEAGVGGARQVVAGKSRANSSVTMLR